VVRLAPFWLLSANRRKKNNEPFLQLHLADATGQVQANIWDNVLAAAKAFEAGHVLEIVGTLSSFQDRLQITIERSRIVPEAEIKFADFPAGTTGKPDELSSDTASDSFQQGEWLSTDASAQMAMIAQQVAEQLKQKFVPGSTPKQEQRLCRSLTTVPIFGAGLHSCTTNLRN
jgi:hypothetical protein